MSAAPRDRASARRLLGDPRQHAAVRRIVLDDGPERGVRALAFSTGGGLDFWALADRSLDIGPLWRRGRQLGWQSPNGFRAPALHDAEGDGGRGIERSLSGLLVTCGLDHVRRPESGAPLHGRLPLTPARVIACGEDWERAEPALFAEGEVTQARLNGEMLRLRRRIEAPIGGARIVIDDAVENLGPAAQAHDLLYHVNLGHPLVGPEATLALDGAGLAWPDGSGGPAVSCRAIGATRPVAVTAAGDGAAITLRFDAASLPFLQLWRNALPGINVGGIEPCTADRAASVQSSVPGPPLAPGEIRRYRLELEFG